MDAPLQIPPHMGISQPRFCSTGRAVSCGNCLVSAMGDSPEVDLSVLHEHFREHVEKKHRASRAGAPASAGNDVPHSLPGEPVDGGELGLAAFEVLVDELLPVVAA
jgi:hypothetical protein